MTTNLRHLGGSLARPHTGSHVAPHSVTSPWTSTQLAGPTCAIAMTDGITMPGCDSTRNVFGAKRVTTGRLEGGLT